MRINYFKKPTRKRFIDAFPKFEREEGDDASVDFFYETWTNSPFYSIDVTKTDLKDIYNHLCAKYYDWHFIYADDFGIKMNVMHVIHDYYPNVKERLSLVGQLRSMTLDEFKKSGLSINSQGANPKVATDMDELIDLVDSQTANFVLKSDEQALRAKFNALYDGVMDEFIERFSDQFVKLYTGLTGYIYTNSIEGEDEE